MNEKAKKPVPLKGSMAIFKGKKIKCKKTSRLYVVVDALLSHKPIVLPGNRMAGNVQGIIIQTVIHPNQLGDFVDIQEKVPTPNVKA